MLWLDSQACVTIRTGRLLTRKSRVKVYEQTSPKKTRVWNYLWNTWMFIKRHPFQRKWINYTHYESHPLSTAIPVFAQWTYMQNAMAREREGMYRPNMNFPSPRLTRRQLLLITLPTNSKYQSWATNMTPFSRRKSQLSDHRLITLNSFSQGLSSNLSSL